MNQPNKNTAGIEGGDYMIFERFYQLLAVISICLIIMPYINNFISAPLGLFPIISVIITVLCVAFGYLVQAFYSKIMHTKRVKLDSSYEGMNTYFSVKNALLPMTLFFIVSIAAKNIASMYMLYRYETGMDYYYDKNSLYPFLIMAAVFIAFAAGAIMWFFPYHRIISMKTFFPFTAIFIIGFIISIQNPAFITAAFTLYLFNCLVIMNQGYMVHSIDRTQTVLITPQMRFYNIAMIFILILCAVVMFFGISAVLVGIIILAKMFLFFSLKSMFGNNENGGGNTLDAVDSAISFNQKIFNLKGIGIHDTNVSIMLFSLFLITVLFVIILFIISRKINIFKIIGSFLSNFYQSIINFLSNLYCSKRNSYENNRFNRMDYKDIDEKMSADSVRQYIVKQKNAHLTWREYSRHLSALKSSEERLNYSYNTLISCFSEMNFGLRSSDTPREIESKVAYHTSINDIDTMTNAFELMKYSASPYSDADSDEFVNKMSALIKKYTDS